MGRMPDPNEDERVERPSADDDTEGHSLSLVMGLDALARPRDRKRTPRPADEELPPLTKPFPRMRDDRRR